MNLKLKTSHLKLLAALLPLAFCLALAGCTTVTTPTGTTTSYDPVKAAAAVRSAVPPLVRYALTKEPGAKPYVCAVSAALHEAVAGQTSDPDELAAALENVGVKELTTPEAKLVMEELTALYRANFADVVAARLSGSAALPILQALADGLDEGMR